MDSWLLPAEFNWERDAVGFYTRYHGVFVGAAALYLPAMFGIKKCMAGRASFDLGGAPRSASRPAGSMAPVNWIFWWEASLALFSMIGAYYVVPMVISHIQATSLLDAICNADLADAPASAWGFLFSVSKVVEMGDTLLVVLRKKPLIFLQYYHHLATMVYCWYGTVFIYKLNNSNMVFAALNLAVHSIMYSWYAATRTGWKSPKALMMTVTLLQLLQMVAGIAITVVASSHIPGTSCGRWSRHDPWGNKAAFIMYGSYMALFGKMFYDNYIVPKPRKLETKDKGS